MYFAYYNITLPDILIIFFVGFFLVLVTTILAIVNRKPVQPQSRTHKIIKYTAMTIGAILFLWGLAWIVILFVGLSQI